MGRRARRREKLTAPRTDYTDPQGNVLTLRGSLTAAARREYAETLAGGGGQAARGRAAETQEDAWQRAVELLFERLTVRWVIAGAPIERQRELRAQPSARGCARRSACTAPSTFRTSAPPDPHS